MDQAETLRRLMRERDDAEAPAAKVITFASGGDAAGAEAKSHLVAALGALMGRAGLRILMVDGDSRVANLSRVLGAVPECGLESVLAGKASLLDAVLEVEKGLWILPSTAAREHGSDRGQDTLLSWSKLSGLLAQCPLALDAVLIDAPGGVGEAVVALHGAHVRSVLVQAAGQDALTEGYGVVKTLRHEAGVQEAGVIVNPMTEAREGLETHQKLKNVASQFLGMRLEYLGHYEGAMKITDSVMKSNFLLNLESGTPSMRSLELIAKRLREMCGLGGEGAVTAGAVQGSRRFQEEPVRTAPRNTAGFWRTLLGEVKT